MPNYSIQRRNSSFHLSAVFFSMFLFTADASAQGVSDYLNELEGEAAGLTLDSNSKSVNQNGGTSIEPTTSDWNPEQQSISKEGLGAGLTPNDFEKTLKSQYFGTYLFYKRLSDSGKQQVYQFYLNNTDPEAIREQVINISKQ